MRITALKIELGWLSSLVASPAVHQDYSPFLQDPGIMEVSNSSTMTLSSVLGEIPNLKSWDQRANTSRFHVVPYQMHVFTHLVVSFHFFSKSWKSCCCFFVNIVILLELPCFSLSWNSKCFLLEVFLVIASHYFSFFKFNSNVTSFLEAFHFNQM